MSETLVRARALAKTYHREQTQVPALRGIDLELHRGDFAILLGRRGAGKTTTLNLLGCMDDPTAGTLWLVGEELLPGGHPLRDSQRDHLRREHIGFVFAEFHLLPALTAQENVELPMIYAGVQKRARATELLEAVGLGHRLAHRPRGLSDGERQRVAIARALVNEPDLLLADEPTANLDTHTRDDIFALLERLNQTRGLTVLLATPDRELATRAHRVIHLENGQIVGAEARVVG